MDNTPDNSRPLKRAYELGGRLFVDEAIEGTQAIQADKWYEWVGVSTVSTPSTGHAKVFLSSSTHLLNVSFDNGSITALGGGTITGVTAGVGLLGGGTSGSVTINLSSAQVNATNVDASSGVINSFTATDSTFTNITATKITTTNFVVTDSTATSSTVSGVSRLGTVMGTGSADVVFKSTISFSPTTIGVRGTTTNDNANVGLVGEYISSNSVTGTFTTSGNYTDSVHFDLTAGDWDITAQVFAIANGANCSAAGTGISTTSGNSSTGLVNGDNFMSNAGPTTTANTTAGIANYRVKLTTTTTYYQKIVAFYGSTAPSYITRMSARRIR